MGNKANSEKRKVYKLGRKKVRGDLKNLKQFKNHDPRFKSSKKNQPNTSQVDVHIDANVPRECKTFMEDQTIINPVLQDNHLTEIEILAKATYDDGIDNLNTLQPSVETEERKRTECLEGRRIVDIAYTLQEMYRLNSHGSQFGCVFGNLEFINEIRNGLSSTLRFKCSMCQEYFKLELNKRSESKMDVNTAAVAGAMSVGIGFSNSEEMFATMDVPYMTSQTYAKYHKSVSTGWQKTAIEKMEVAARQEAEYAVEIGSVDEKGIPLINVVADGCWSKRFYRKNYSALSGVAAIVGQRFGQVLFIGVRNKYCTICQKSLNKNVDPPPHQCSSTSMEADILVDGFKNSVLMYGLKYSKLIADGDSSTYKRILEARPYDNITVEKVECRNHLLRNFCNKLQTMCTDTRFPLKLRKLLGKNISRMRSAIVGAIAHNKTKGNGIALLQKDVNNIFNHVFGYHDECEDYFCQRKNLKELNYSEEIKQCAEFYFRINISYLQGICQNARSLIEDVDSNVVEHFNSTIAKFVGGKRINYSLRQSYNARCSAAVVSFNTGRPHYELHKSMFLTSPSVRVKRMELNRRRKIERALKKRFETKQNRVRRKLCTGKIQDSDYGEFCQKPDMLPDVHEFEKHKFLEQLSKTMPERVQLERDTILQSGSGQWLEHRRKILTASNFHSVCSRRQTRSCSNLVKKLLYGADLHAPAIVHGRKNEPRAKFCLQQQGDTVIKDCGLFIHDNYAFLGASPDGIVDEHLIVEIKCPFSAYNHDPDEAIRQKKIKFWTYNPITDTYQVNCKHAWYHQIQGQLQITNRMGCIFGVWTGDAYPLKVEYIRKDSKFWNDHMLAKLVNFYNDCVLPELVDPRQTRNMPIRDPPYVGSTSSTS